MCGFVLPRKTFDIVFIYVIIILRAVVVRVTAYIATERNGIMTDTMSVTEINKFRDDMKTWIIGVLTPEQRIILAELALGEETTRLLAMHGGVKLYGTGREFAPEPDTYAVTIDDEYQSSEHITIEHAFDDLDYFERADFSEMYDKIRKDGPPNWHTPINLQNTSE